MTSSSLHSNAFFNYLMKECRNELLQWKEPSWRICIPCQEALSGYQFNKLFAENHALQQTAIVGEMRSVGCGQSRLFQLVENALLLLQESSGASNHCDSLTMTSADVIVNKISIIDEHFEPMQDNTVLHILLVSEVLDPTLKEETLFLPQLDNLRITSASNAEQFLRWFSCHWPVLDELSGRVHAWQRRAAGSVHLTALQTQLHDLLLGAWSALIARHSSLFQTSPAFQDLLFTALDFVILGWCHSVVWWRVRECCGALDDMVNRRLRHLRLACLTPEQLGLMSFPATPVATPAAVVELAALDTPESALARLHGIHAAVLLLLAHAKQARAELQTYTGQECCREEVSDQELLGLLMMALIEAQSLHLASNLYYITHYVFSVPDAHPLKHSVLLVREALQELMQLDVTEAVQTPCKPPLRRELSLHDLMKISNEVEQRFERPQTARGSGTVSSPDISSLDLHWQQLTDQIQRSTMESSTINECPIMKYSPRTPPASPFCSVRRISTENCSPLDSVVSSTQSGRLVGSFMEFVSSLPSSIRASFRRKQTEQRLAVDSNSVITGPHTIS